MQIWAESGKSALPICNYSQILYQFLTFTQNLKRSHRRLNRQRSVFPSDTALLKALYLATFEATKKWTMSIRNWGQVYGELSIMYEGRPPA